MIYSVFLSFCQHMELLEQEARVAMVLVQEDMVQDPEAMGLAQVAMVLDLEAMEAEALVLGELEHSELEGLELVLEVWEEV